MQKTQSLFHSRTLLVILCAIVMGFISGKLLFLNGSALNIVPWGILTFACAFIATSKRQAIKLSGLFAFVVSYSFLWFNNTDPKTFSRSVIVLALAGVAALFGLLCGFALGWLGWKAKQSHGKVH